MIPLVALLVLVILGGCSDREYHEEAEPARPVAQPSAATLTNCHLMYPTQPDLEQACIRRWTVGEALLEPTTPPQNEGDTVGVLVQWCAGLAGIPPVHQDTHRMTPEEALRLVECMERRSRR